VSVVASIVFTLRSQRMSHSFTSPPRQPLTSSRCPPRCRWTLVIHCLCSFQTLTMAVAGFWRWSYTRIAPSPKPATKTSPSTWSEVNEVIQDPDRAGRSYQKSAVVANARPTAQLTLVHTSVPAFHTRITLTSPATRIKPLPCCQSNTRPAFLLLGTRSVKARNPRNQFRLSFTVVIPEDLDDPVGGTGH
jgi:hypothetical protein